MCMGNIVCVYLFSLSHLQQLAHSARGEVGVGWRRTPTTVTVAASSTSMQSVGVVAGCGAPL